MRLLFSLLLFACIWPLSADAEVQLTQSNRMLPLLSLYQPIDGNAQQLTLVNSGSHTTDWMLTQVVPLSGANTSTSQLGDQNTRQWLSHFSHSVTADNSTTSNSDSGQIASNKRLSDDIIFAPLVSSPNNALLAMSQQENLSNNNDVQPLSHLKQTQLRWPLPIIVTSFQLAPGQSLLLVAPSIATAPQQLWAQTWWQFSVNNATRLALLAWGLITCLLLMQLLLKAVLPYHSNCCVGIHLLATVMLAFQMGALGDLVPPLITQLLVSSSLTLGFLVLGFRHFLRSEHNTYAKVILIMLMVAAVIGAAHPLLTAVANIQTLHASALILGIVLIASQKTLASFPHGRGQQVLTYIGLTLAISVIVQQQTANTLTDMLVYYASVSLLLIVISTLSLMGLKMTTATATDFLLAETPHYLGPKEQQLAYSALKREYDELQFNLRLLQQKNAIDFLTGLKNRQFFDEKYHYELARSARDKLPMSLIMMDLDYFKKINDVYGHQVGDEVLKAVSKRFYFVIKRPADALCRYGGEEFAVLLPNTPSKGAHHIAELIKQGISSQPIATARGDINVTISLGIATVVHTNDGDPKVLLQLADKALYRAKENGRNRIEVAPNEFSYGTYAETQFRKGAH